MLFMLSALAVCRISVPHGLVVVRLVCLSKDRLLLVAPEQCIHGGRRRKVFDTI